MTTKLRTGKLRNLVLARTRMVAVLRSFRGEGKTRRKDIDLDN
jgi:hypothetical protein